MGHSLLTVKSSNKLHTEITSLKYFHIFLALTWFWENAFVKENGKVNEPFFIFIRFWWHWHFFLNRNEHCDLKMGLISREAHT